MSPVTKIVVSSLMPGNERTLLFGQGVCGEPSTPGSKEGCKEIGRGLRWERMRHKRGAASWSGSGGTSARFMTLDSMPDTVIAVAVDERSNGYTERFTSLGGTEAGFAEWSARIREIMDDAHRVKQ